jgi:O-antigen/teichoic acid export membrane protein
MSASAGTARRSLLTNAAANWVGFVVQLSVAFFLSPLLVHRLGGQRYGIWSLIESVLAYLMLFDLGVAASVVRYVAKFEATQDRDSLNRVFSTSVGIFAVAGVLVQLIALALAAVGPQLLGIPGPLVEDARWLLVLLGFNLAAGLPLSVFSCVLDGLGRFSVKTSIRTAYVLVRSGLFVLIVGNGGGLVPLAWAITGCSLAEHLGIGLAARHFLPQLRFSLRLIDRATFRAIRGYSADAFLAMLAGRISFQTDAIVIGLFLSPQYITYFVIAGRLVEYSKDSLRVLTTVLTPAVSVLEAKGETASIRRLLLDSTRYVLWLIMPIQLGLLILGRPFLTLWMGPQYDAGRSYPSLVILAVPLALALSQSVSVRILYGIGCLRWFARAVIVEAVVNLLLSVALVTPLGIEGVALGTAVPNVVANLALAAYVCRTLGVGFGEFFGRSFLAPLALAAGLAAFWLAAAVWSPPETWAALIGTGAAGLLGYLALAVLAEFGLKNVVRFLKPGGGKFNPGPLPDPAAASSRL